MSDLEKKVKELNEQITKITDLMLEATNKDIIKNLEQRTNDITHQKDILEAELQKHKLLYNCLALKKI